MAYEATFGGTIIDSTSTHVTYDALKWTVESDDIALLQGQERISYGITVRAYLINYPTN